VICQAANPAVGIGAARAVPDGGGATGLRALSRLLAGGVPVPGLDWPTMLDLARAHAVSPLLYWRLEKEGQSTCPGDGMPPEVWDELESDFYTAAARELMAERQLAEILGLLAEEGISVLVAKGAAVGAFYPDPALRPFGDLDLLVPQVQAKQAEEALHRLGYSCSMPKAWWSDHLHHLPPMVRDEGSLAIEVHWRLDHEDMAGRLPAEDLWARAVSWSVEGQPALRLDAVDMALHLCLHAVVQHRARLGLRPLCDLAQVTDGWEQERWDALVRRTEGYGLARPVYLMLVMLEQLLGRDLPAEVMATLEPAGSAPLPEGVAEALLKLEPSMKARVPVAAVQAGFRGTFAARLHYFLRHLFLPRDGMAVVYSIPANSPRIWLTYLWRPVHLLRRYGGFTWGALLGRQEAYETWQRELWLEQWLAGEDQAR